MLVCHTPDGVGPRACQCVSCPSTRLSSVCTWACMQRTEGRNLWRTSPIKSPSHTKRACERRLVDSMRWFDRFKNYASEWVKYLDKEDLGKIEFVMWIHETFPRSSFEILISHRRNYKACLISRNIDTTIENLIFTYVDQNGKLFYTHSKEDIYKYDKMLYSECMLWYDKCIKK